MSAWIKTTLRDCIAALTKIEEAALAAALRRLMEDPQLDAIQLFRDPKVADLADMISETDSFDGLHEKIVAVAAAFEAHHCTIHCIREREEAFLWSRVLTTFPREWIAEYIGARYSTLDPVIARCFTGPGLFFWDELDGRHVPAVGAFMRRATEQGVGPSGITFVGESTQGDTIAVSMASRIKADRFRELFEPKMSDFVDMALLMIEVFSNLGSHRAGNSAAALTGDQLKILRAVASGRTPAEIASLDLPSGSALSLEKSILSLFGARTLAQATAIAIKRGLFERLPYCAEDIFIADGGIA